MAISFSVLIFAFDRPTRSEPVLARAQHARVIERIADRHEPAVDRGGACDRDLLRHDDLREPGKAARRGGAAAARPVRATTGAQRGSAAISAAMPASRSASVWMWVVMRHDSRHRSDN